MNSNLLNKAYEFDKIEKKWYIYWEKNGLFSVDKYNRDNNFSMVLPPPNITGALHMGHALNNTLQDILCRYSRFKHNNVLWIPGTDHAGIATQNVVEKKLISKGIKKNDIGRSKFIENIWVWKSLYGKTITEQMKRMGTSCDWNKERFTLDDRSSLAVKKVFVKLYNDNLIYKDRYVINWCPRCQTALSDLEVAHIKCNEFLYKIKYHYIDSSNYIVVATTRPETLFGDVAVAINPLDDRSLKMKGKTVVVPLVERIIPIIEDKYVDKSFGTGLLKITPAHDPNDFSIGIRHNLQIIKVIDEKGRMNSNALTFDGLDRYKCREQLINSLKKQNLLESVEPYECNIGTCYRCKTTIEFNLSKQWFIKIKSLADKAIQVVKNKEIRIFPSHWTKTYYDWLENVKDWCISRQLWWGHRIPAWTCENCSNLLVVERSPIKCPECGSNCLNQDPDVLDTWFSSSLWPFSTLGWPKNSELFDKFYPTSVLVTGFDILFFWVARMIMLGIYVTNKIPFKNVYVHALVRDNEGKKMSKSKGNVINPIDIINKYGTDSLRFTLSILAVQGRDIKLSERKIKGYSHFVNKIWNAAKFSLPHLKIKHRNLKKEDLSFVDCWILLKFSKMVKKVSTDLDNYRFSDAANSLYHFIWHEFCDWYLEFIKPTVYSKYENKSRESTLSVLRLVFHDLLIVLHPFMPFVTEELWHKIPGTCNSIMKSNYPVSKKDYEKNSKYDNIEENMKLIISLISEIRNLKSEMNISPSIKLDILFKSKFSSIREVIESNEKLIISIANLNSLKFNNFSFKPKSSITILLEKCTIYVLLKNIINSSDKISLYNKKKNKISKKMNELERKLSNNRFLKNAPLKIVEKVKKEYHWLLEKKNKINTFLDKIVKMDK